MALTDRFKKDADRDYGDTPNVVNLNLPSDRSRDGAAWVYLPSKDTIYIGPRGSYHVDIASSLKTLVDKKKEEKPVTGVLYDDGYADYFDKVDQKDADRILRALQNYHSENYVRDFNDAENDAGAWDDSGGHILYPTDEDYEDPDEKGTNGLDTYNPGGYDPNEDDTFSYPDFDTRSWGGKNNDYKQLKPTPGMDKPIHQWDIQDYLDWRDKKHWKPGGYFATPREDYPHFRWSYGDSKIMPGCPHEGLWVWPTHNGYPDHFAQTGHNGLGNCAQGRIYPHTGDRWEILTWPGRPRNAPSEATRQFIQQEAQEAVKQYVMEKIGVPEDKIFFTNMHYTSAVTMYNSPSYPDEAYDYYNSTPVSRNYHYDWEPLEDWNSIPEGTWNLLKDPSGREWQRSSLPASEPGKIKLYAVDGQQPSHYEVDPTKDYVAGWEIGKKVYGEAEEERDVPNNDVSNENPYDWNPGTPVNPSETIREFYERIKKDKDPQPLGQKGDTQTGPPAGALKNPDLYHRNPDGSYARLNTLKTKGDVLFNWDPNVKKWTWQQVTPEEAYGIKVRWFEEDQASQQANARKVFPEAFGEEVPPQFVAPGRGDADTGDELDENGDLRTSSTGEWYVQSNGLVAFRAPDGNNIHVTAEDFKLSYQLHGEDWWKSFIPNRSLTTPADLWNEIV